MVVPSAKLASEVVSTMSIETAAASVTSPPPSPVDASGVVVAEDVLPPLEVCADWALERSLLAFELTLGVERSAFFFALAASGRVADRGQVRRARRSQCDFAARRGEVAGRGASTV